MRFAVIAGAALALMGCQSGPERQAMNAQPQQKLQKVRQPDPRLKPTANCALDRSGPSAYSPCL